MNFLRSEEHNSRSWVNEPIAEQLPVVDLNDFLPHIHKWTSVGVIVLVSIFCLGVGSTTVLKYKVTVKVPATIRPVGDLRLVESAISGMVQKIVVKENQIVSQGEAIAYVDDSRLQTQKMQLNSSIQQSQLQLIQIDAQLDEINTQIVAQANLISRTVVAGQAELVGTRRDFLDRQIRANAELTQARVALRLAKSQLERLQTEKVLTATIEEAQAALNLAKVQRDRLGRIATSGAISRSMVEEKEQAVKSAAAQLEQAKNNAKNQLEEKQQAFEVAQTNLDKARAAINPSNSSVIVAAERIRQEQAKGEANLAGLKQQQQNLLQQRLEMQKQMIRSRQELQQTQNDLNKSVIRAPIGGTILQLKLRNPGQVLQPSEAIAQIAPLNAPLLIKAYVPAQDINKVEVNQKVQMQVSACPYPDYGTLNGTVKTVAPDAIQPPKTDTPGINTSQPAGYEVTIEPENPYLQRGDRQCHLQPGMEGRADIISREETVMQFILRKGRLITDL
ncbi:secretion protein HlyD family protein [Richelia sinica FACHB-800]|uniref:Secretion protein HlyD family protein n=1 Tax=Richelia sinica FACHB-800 TaxID=1357546 RepID=A0A975T4L9_9NOST|nr:HlyD family efflux transporter periplasmic adaptor subunit [Richelia sinica]MBD2665583.1 HlyD family efflux transporter periplasmic adaptor subunit [Richelia sinica FACHB-800]QXE21347.1 secretion protein HlyD family protein [Richelia sinica FACHB-800]